MLNADSYPFLLSYLKSYISNLYFVKYCEKQRP